MIGAAGKGDKEAAWAKLRARAWPQGRHRRRLENGIIRDVESTPANGAGVAIAPAIIPDAPGEVYAGRAYDALSEEKADRRRERNREESQGPPPSSRRKTGGA